MSSVTVSELKHILNGYPDDYEVIMSWHWKDRNVFGDIEEKHSIAMINAVEANDDYREVRLMN